VEVFEKMIRIRAYMYCGDAMSSLYPVMKVLLAHLWVEMGMERRYKKLAVFLWVCAGLL
jgi:hypothetical protein